MLAEQDHELQSFMSSNRQSESTELKAIQKTLVRRLGISFFLFGLINNVLYVIILSAALDLVPPSTPKGIILFFNIFPALVAKVGWPYILKGRIRYGRRVGGCCGLSVLGMVVVAAFEGLWMRLLGIGLASFSSGLGELTFLQLSTTYSPPSVAGSSVGYFASGTGAAGLVGAFLWWEVRGFGVRKGVGLSAVMPFIIPLAYHFLLPRPSAFTSLTLRASNDDESVAILPASSYIPIPVDEDEDETTLEVTQSLPKAYRLELSLSDKWRLVRPLVGKFMLPLFCVYLFEYTINQGIAPTLLYPVPTPSKHKLLSWIVHSVRDYYPLWQLVYQATVFLSRSSITLGLPPLPHKMLTMPAIVQAFILIILSSESAWGIFERGGAVGEEGEGLSVALVFILISLEGICGGLAYVNVFYRINQLPVDPNLDPTRTVQEREFMIGSIGCSDSLGILWASALSVPMEVGLCRLQVRRGKVLCKGL